MLGSLLPLSLLGSHIPANLTPRSQNTSIVLRNGELTKGYIVVLLFSRVTSADQTVQRQQCTCSGYNKYQRIHTHTHKGKQALRYTKSALSPFLLHHHQHHHTCLTGEKGDFVEGALQLSHENVHKTIFGQMPCFFGTLVINHHFLLPAQLNLHRR